MILSYNQIKENVDLSLTEVVSGLVQLGHEVETVESVSNEKLIIGLVLSVESHPNADKLNIAKVDIGNEVLQIVCGAPNLVVGKYVITAIKGCKLEKITIEDTTIREVSSFGMLCSLGEIGIEENYLTSSDIDGIYLFDKECTPGENALEALGLADHIIDVSLTANRGDCQSYVGIYRDLSALLNVEYKIPKQRIKSGIDNPFIVEINDNTTKQLHSLYLRDVNITESPTSLRIWLIKHMIKPQNIIVDTCTFVLLTLGVPMHAYDADKIKGGIYATEVEAESEFVGLDGQSYNLKKGCLVIKDDEKICAIASVIGSEDTKITTSTTKVLVEIGLFDPVKVRRSAQIIGRKTDASQRGEKNIDELQISNAFSVFLKLLLLENSSFVNSTITSKINANNIVNNQELYFKEIEDVLGIKVCNQEAISILENLGFELIDKNDEKITVKVPSWRFDIESDHDLIEEIIRVYSLDKIDIYDTVCSFFRKDNIIVDNKAKFEREMEALILNYGLNQVVTYSLVSEDDMTLFGQDKNLSVELMMPLSNLHKYYRLSLLPSLLSVHSYNFNRKQKTSNIFEIANVYVGEEQAENLLISGLVSGVKCSDSKNNTDFYDFYDSKFYVEKILNHLNIEFDIVANTTDSISFNKYACADVVSDGEVIGVIGKIHPNLLGKQQEDVYVFEINVTKFTKVLPNIISEPIGTNQAITRDITINVPKNEVYSKIISVFEDIQYVSNCKLVNTYDKDATIAYTFRVGFDSDKQLTNEQVELSFKSILENINGRGYEFNC